MELSLFSENIFVEPSKMDDDDTVELVDLLSSSMLFSIESSDDHPSLTFEDVEHTDVMFPSEMF
jgi:hypothetical protein